MVWELSGEFQFGLYSLSALVAGVLTYALMRLSRRWWIAVPSAWLMPPVLMLGYFLYLESLQPVGPFYAVVGFSYVVPVLLAGAVGTGGGLMLFHFRNAGE